MEATTVKTQGVPAMFYAGVEILAIILAVVILHAILRFIFVKKRLNGEEVKEFLYPKAIRVWHWSNFIIFTTLLTTGLFIWLKLAPKSILMPIHLVFAILFIFTWTFVVSYNAAVAPQNYKFGKGFTKNLLAQIRYYSIGIFKNEPNPHTPTKEDKFNPLQKLSYFFMIYVVMPVFIISGILEQIKDIHKIMVQTHIFFCTFSTCIFILLHVYMVFCGDYFSQRIKSMFDGYSRHYK